MKNFSKWLQILISGKPHFIVGSLDDPYLLRWYLVPRNNWFGIYLHQFKRDDDDRALHDHPWSFISIMLKGSYKEHTDDGVILRAAPSIAFRKAEHRHRVELVTESCWTLIFKGRVVREWGFWCPKGFVHWSKFTAQDNPGEIGRGCGE